MKKALTVIIAIVISGMIIPHVNAKTQPTKEKPMVLKMATHVLPTHFLMAKGVFPEWKEKIEKETGGRIQIRIYDSQSLGKLPDEWNMLKSGVSDIGWIIFSFYRGVFPLSEVLSQPGLVPKEGQELAYYNAMFDKYLEKEFHEVKPFFPNILGSTYLNTKKPVRTLDDLKGMQIRCGSSQKNWLKAIGGTPATMPPSELYTGLERGIVEGCTFPLDGVKSFKLYEVTKYHTPTNLGLGMGVLAMNKKVWERLPSDIQVIFTNMNPWLQQKMYQANIEASEEAKTDCVKNGNEIIQFSDEQKALLHELTFPLAEEWAKKKDAKGLPGTEVLNYARNLLGQ